MLPKSQFSKLIFGHSAGQTKVDRPHYKQFRYKKIHQQKTGFGYFLCTFAIQVTVCVVTVCPFSRHKGNQRPKSL